VRLGDTYSSERLEAACERALALDIGTYKSVAALLKSGLPMQETDPEEASVSVSLVHENIRGAAYYRTDQTKETVHA
jgi:hypothetical protein